MTSQVVRVFKCHRYGISRRKPKQPQSPPQFKQFHRQTPPRNMSLNLCYVIFPWNMPHRLHNRGVSQTPYPQGYIIPKFPKYDGVKGDTDEHLQRFVESLGQHSHDEILRLREFSKFLTELAYRWFRSLEPDSVTTWQQLSQKFHDKFGQAIERVTTLSFTKETQESHEEPLKFISRFQTRARECFEASSERDLVDICIQGMTKTYMIHLVNLGLNSFSDFTTAVRNICKDLVPPKAEVAGQVTRKDTLVAPRNDRAKKRRETDVRAKGSRAERTNDPPPFPVCMEEVASTLEQWVKHGVVVLPVPHKEPTAQDRASLNFCIFHQATSHPTSVYRILRQIFRQRLEGGDLELTVPKDVWHNPYPRHRGVAVVTYYDEFEETNPTQSKVQAQYGEEECCAAASSSQPSSYQAPLTISFSESDKRVSTPQNRPLYVTEQLNGREFQHAFLDNGSSINIMPWATFQKASLLQDRLVKEAIEVYGFGNESHQTLGSVNVDLAVGRFRAPTKFHVVKADTSYHVLLGWAWMHRFGIVASTYHQCFKGILGNKVIMVPCSDKPFAKHEAHFTEALFFDELDDEDEEAEAHIIRTPLPKWEEVQQGIFYTL
ncbi:uncharacterized protein LOC132277678 [Cornus florida]|uniref:uncharacterized protein LOC132277678 n=1 Tax=Cornus florida TaxID=4283 RepID=UPI00289A48C8|nr:uncharacterized protein LOC132277678 [Cornus florida]